MGHPSPSRGPTWPPIPDARLNWAALLVRVHGREGAAQEAGRYATVASDLGDEARARMWDEVRRTVEPCEG